MLIKKTRFIGTLIALSIPFVAHADLTIVNNTDAPSTSIVNGGKCSSAIPVYGITQPNTTNVIPSWPTLYLACLGNLTACQAQVYMTSNCSGEAIATVTLNTKTGETGSIPGNNSKYKVTANGMNISLDFA